jgi:hypothetical protein
LSNSSTNPNLSASLRPLGYAQLAAPHRADDEHPNRLLYREVGKAWPA